MSPERFDMLIKGSCFKEQREFETESLKFLAPPQPFFPEGQQAERTRQIEAKDMTTHDHLQRVQIYAIEIGQELGLKGEALEAFRVV